MKNKLFFPTSCNIKMNYFIYFFTTYRAYLHSLFIIWYKLLCSLGTVIIAWKLEEGLTRQTLKKRIIMGTKKATTIKPHRATQCSVCRFCASWLSLTVPLHSRQFDKGNDFLKLHFGGFHLTTLAKVIVYILEGLWVQLPLPFLQVVLF